MAPSAARGWRFPVVPLTLAALSGLLLCLSFPRWELYPLAWFALVPLFYALEGTSPKRAFLIGWMAGLVYFAGTLSWVTISMSQYGKIPGPISYALMLLLVSYLAVYVGLFAAGARLAFRRHAAALLLIPCLWTALELVRGHLLTGFPWSALAYSQYRFLPAIQIADLAGIYGVGFVIILINVALYQMIRDGLRRRWREGLVTAGLLLLVFGYGWLRLSQPMGEPRGIPVSVVQGNIDQDQKWDVRVRNETIEKYKRLSLSPIVKGETRPALVVWPESAAPFFFQTEPVYREELLHLAGEGRFYLLFGSPAFEPAPSGQLLLLNSAYLLSPAAQVVSRYDKMHLVPFGEYIPLSSILFFVNKMVEGIGEFIPGRDATVMEADGARIGTVICFEVIFPEVVRRFAQNGATVMTTITNDAWFGDSAAPYQHFSMVVFRAIENRVPFARAANTGISGFYDAKGHILQQSPLFAEATLTETLHPGIRRTFYTDYGDLFAFGCVIIAVGFTLISFRERRKTDAD
ncbi:MAG: apolipoprotein N-acyltransferase [Nitrospirae bacterium]|nr:apolipoprotein N-acyltransferase [Candidatus Manganitrophaceae bacterium]